MDESTLNLDRRITPAAMHESSRTIKIPQGTWWRRMFAFAGPAYLIAVGYMDPGNWATDIQGGTLFGYRLIWILLLSNAMAILLQALSARLGLATGRDLAQACRDSYGNLTRWSLFILCELAIAACDLAEVLGTAIGLHLLTGIAIVPAVLITGLDVLLLLAIQRWGMRRMEALIVSLISMIGACFIVEIFLSHPHWPDVARGFIPTPLSNAGSPSMLYVAIGIIGATVMPHNLYLHSALVQSRDVPRTQRGVQQAFFYNLWDAVIALNLAFLVNCAILIVAAAAFYKSVTLAQGFDAGAKIGVEEAHALLDRLLGTRIAPIAFALALICAGQSSTLTGTLAGQITMEGFLHLRVRPWLRRLVTRSLAIIPAIAVISLKHGQGSDDLLILSQVVLSLQLPFAMIPLIKFTNSRERMGPFANPFWLATLAWLVTAIILGLNGYLVYGQVRIWHGDAGEYGWLVYAGTLPILAALGSLLLWLMVGGRRPRLRPQPVSAGEIASAALLLQKRFARIAVALEAAASDAAPLAEAIALAKTHQAQLYLFHIVEGAGGQWHGEAADDTESREDENLLRDLAARLRADLANQGISQVHPVLGYGNVPRELARLASKHQVDLLVTGGHGHRGIADLFRGETIGGVRHRLAIPVLAVRTPKI